VRRCRDADGRLGPSSGWYCFDDQTCEPWDVSKLDPDCYGGKYVVDGYDAGAKGTAPQVMGAWPWRVCPKTLNPMALNAPCAGHPSHWLPSPSKRRSQKIHSGSRAHAMPLLSFGVQSVGYGVWVLSFMRGPTTRLIGSDSSGVCLSQQRRLWSRSA
jgi:hypothetical protein